MSGKESENNNSGKTVEQKGRVENLKHWEPGQSGNPNGRPKGQSFKTVLSDMLEKKIDAHDPLLNESRNMTVQEKISLNLIAKAIADVKDGDLKELMSRDKIQAINTIMDRIDGKPPQAILGPGGGPIVTASVVIDKKDMETFYDKFNDEY